MPWMNPDDIDKAFEWSLTADPCIFLCSAEPTTYTQATVTYALAQKLDWVSTIEPRSPTGRKLVISEITSGNPGDNIAGGTATHWAVVDMVNEVLRATGELAASKVIVDGDTFTLPAFSYGIAQLVSE